MPAPLRITLTEEEDRTLSELRQAQSVPYRTRDRAHMLRLNAQGMNVPAIAEVFQCHQQTVRATLKRWQQHGLGGLWEAPGRGAKAKWQPADLDYLTDCLAQEQRTYNSAQLAQKLKQERLVDLSSDRLRRLLKKKGNWSPQQNCLIANGAKVCSIRVMKPPRPEPTLPEIDPEEQGARYWYERYCEQLAETEQLKRRVKELEKQFESLNEKLRKLSERTSETSSQPPSSDGPKKPNRDQQKPQRKRGPKYNHPGTTRNGFGWINHAELLDVQNCPICGGAVERQPQGTQRQQVAELVPELVEVWEYERPLYRCPACGWQGYQDLPLGCREGFSYGGRLSSVVGWLGYGG
jgi:transposase